MINILSSALYRIIKSKYMYVCLILALILPVLSNALVYVIIDIAESAGAGSVVTYFADPVQNIAIMCRIDNDNALFVLIAVALFVASEFADGNLRNTIIANKSRTQIYLAYLVVAFLMVFAVVFVSTLSTFISSLAFFGNPEGFSAGYMVGALFAYLGVQLITMSFVGAGTMFLCMLFKKRTGGIIMSIVIFVLVLPLVIELVKNALMFSTTVSLEALSWIPLLNLTLISSTIDGALIAKCVLELIVLLGALLTGMAFYFKRTDIK